MVFQHVQRTIIFVSGVFIMSFGIAVGIRADLGTTPLASLPTVLSFATPLSVGWYIVILNMIFFLLQVLILRRRFTRVQLMQIPITFVFGSFVDLSMYFTRWIEPTSYLTQWIWVLVSVVLVAIGVYIETLPRLSYLPGNGVVVALTVVQNRISFGSNKIILDVVLLIISVAASLLLMGELAGVREGTVFSAVTVGIIIPIVEAVHKRFRIRRAGRSFSDPSPGITLNTL
ncbi:YitT family protein [Yaniella flava]|uniref:YitT family protein n=1 Tax=Yaniella flava TaxID=287930 RepID=A0ABN2UD86_9MICC